VNDHPELLEMGSAQTSPLQGFDSEAERLRAQLSSRERRVDELTRALAALLDEQKDLHVRLERESARVLDSERAKLALHLLDLSDHLDRALAVAKDDASPLAQGVRLIHDELGKKLAQLGLERLSLVGALYDPNLAEAVDLVQAADLASDGKVVLELSPGFRVGDKLIRAARVSVARHAAAKDV